MSDTKSMPTPELLIREPRESEFPACRILLPDACAHPEGRLFRLAFDSAKPGIAAALSYYDDASALNGVRLHVVKTRRRCGIGSRLIAYLMDEARRLGRSRVLVDADLTNEPEAEHFLSSHGFHRIGGITSVGGPNLARCENGPQVRALMAAAEPLPASARMVGISEVPLDQILKLYAEHIASMPTLSGRLIIRAEDYPESIVLMIDDQVVGYILANISGDVVRVPALVVIPEYRRKHVAIRLIVALDDRLGGIASRGEFDFADTALFTAKLAAQIGYEVVRSAARFERSAGPIAAD